MNVKVKKLTPTAVIPYKTHQDDFCYDITATSCEQISPGVYRYGTGIALAIDDPLHTYPSDILALGLTIRPHTPSSHVPSTPIDDTGPFSFPQTTKQPQHQKKAPRQPSRQAEGIILKTNNIEE